MIEAAKIRKRIVVIGLGDTGVLVATGLSKQFDVTAVTPRPFYLNSQNLGARLAWPDFWEKVAKIATDRFARLDPVRIVHGLATKVDLKSKTVKVTPPEGSETVLTYDALVIASGAENGFWRRTLVETWQEEAQRRQNERAPLERASSIAIVGGGASGVSCAAGLAERYPDKSVRLYCSGETVLPEFPRRAALTMMKRLKTLGVECHPNHRAVRPKPEDMRVIKPGRVAWQSGQEPIEADAIIWALGKQTPNSNYLPDDILDDAGFVRVRPTLQIEASDHVFCVGDLAASDPRRSSARNNGADIVVANVQALFGLSRKGMQTYRAPSQRWGEIITSPMSGMILFTPRGHALKFPRWFVKRVIFDLVLFRLIYGGIKKAR